MKLTFMIVAVLLAGLVTSAVGKPGKSPQKYKIVGKAPQYFAKTRTAESAVAALTKPLNAFDSDSTEAQ